MLSDRSKSITESATVSSGAKAAKMRSQGKKVINFGVGEPDFTTPKEEIEYAFSKAKEGFTHYTPSAGFDELRTGIANKINKSKYDLKKNNVIVTPTKFAINLAVMVLADPGDEIIIPEPYFLSYPEICKIYGVKPVPVVSEENFSLNLDAIENSITPKTKAIIVANPSNPTGKVYSKTEMKNLQSLCNERGIVLICDLIYEELVYEGELYDVMELDPALENTIIISGFSKSYAMTGWRIGYAVSNTTLVNAMDKMQQQTITCAPSVSQLAAIKALGDTTSPKAMKEVFRKRRDLIVSLISEIDGLKLTKPEGAFYVFPKYELNISSVELCDKLIASKGILVTPGSAFGSQGEFHIRLSYALSDEEIREGIKAIKEFFEEQGKI